MKKYLFSFISFFFVALVYGQERIITGKVTSADDGSVIPGVNILIRGTTAGTVTDIDGTYRLPVPSSDAVLVFSFVGYLTREITVGNSAVIDMALSMELTTLSEIVVIGYGTQERKDITSAVSTVSAQDMADRPIVQVGEALQGKAAGVQVIQPSGKPGVELSIRIRGNTSVVASNNPIYVIDGIITDNTQGLNPNDIESMSVLKDASAAAIYGSRGANGVVIITTRRGVKGESVVKFDTYFGFSQMSNKIDVLNTDQYRDLMEEVLGPGTVDPAISTNTDWQNEVYKTGFKQNYQLSFSGGNEKSRYLVSGGYIQDKGMVRPARVNQYNFRLNLDHQVKKWLNVTSSINYSRILSKNTDDNLSSGRGGVIMSSLNTPPFLNIYNPANPEQYDPNPFQPSWENPVAYMEGPDQNVMRNRLLGNIAANATIFKGLTYNVNLGMDYSGYRQDWFLDPIKTNYGRQNNGIGNWEMANNTTMLFENLLNYSISTGSHNFKIMAGTSFSENKWENMYIAGSDFPKTVSVTTLNAANSTSGESSQRSEWALFSYLGRISYDFNDKYLLQANFRSDGSSKLDPSRRWDFFPSFSVGWRISDESFMDGLNFISDLKLRGGWGQLGNVEGLPDYLSYQRYGFIRVPLTDPLSGPATYLTGYDNPDLTWETTTQTNLGLDASLLNNRVTLTLDAYIKKTDGLLLDVVLPSTLPLDHILRNDGKMENKGIEIAVSSVNINKGDLRWDTDFNISFNHNEITELGLADTYYFGTIYSNNQDVIILQPGYSVGTFFGYKMDGVNPETGDLEFQDLNNNGYTDPYDRTVIGNAQPDFIYGLTNSLSFKGIRLALFLQGSQGNQIFNATRVDLEGMYDSKNQSTDVLRRWKNPGDITDIPRAGQGINNAWNSDRFIEDGSYLRVKTVTLGYDFSKDLVDNIGFGRISVYITAQNLFTFTQYSGFDPEVNAFGNSATVLGVDYGTYPQSRAFIFGANLEF